MRITSVLVVYFLMGAVMWGGGVIQWDDSGVGGLIITETDGGVETNSNTTGDVENLGGPLEQAVDNVAGGGLLQAWNFFIKFIGYLFWPITVTQGLNAPVEVVVIVGGLPSFSMLLGVGIIFRRGI